MLEIWLREGRVRLPAFVMIETWPRESGVPRVYGTFFDKLIDFFGVELSRFLVSTLTTL
jgi:hypothetical protein